MFYIDTPESNSKSAVLSPREIATTAGTELALDEKAITLFIETGRLPGEGKSFFQGVSWVAPDPISATLGDLKPGLDPRDLQTSLGELVRALEHPLTGEEPTSEALIAWLLQEKKGVYNILMSPEYAERAFLDQLKDSVGFSFFQANPSAETAKRYLRLITLELWLRDFFDEADDSDQKAQNETAEDLPEKLDTEPNLGKNLDIEVAGANYRRYPLRTRNVEREDSLEDLVAERITEFLANTQNLKPQWWEKEWQIFISEKIVAITQSRSFYVWEIEPGWWAKKLSARITPSSYGYGLSIPWTMELAIREAGLPRILLASVGSVIGKIFGKAGVFYMIAGSGVRAIDGPLESPVYPSYLSAKLAPSKTSNAAKKVEAAVRRVLPEEAAKNFAGVVIIDANDVGRHILGKSSTKKDELLEAIFEDNPLGQGGERTPVCVVANV